MNAIIKALETKDMEVIWFDKRKEITEESIEINRAFGYIMNIPSDYTFFRIVTLPINSRHWVSLRKLSDENYYNLDSKLDKPKSIGSNENFIEYLKKEMSSNSEIFIVISKC